MRDDREPQSESARWPLDLPSARSGRTCVSRRGGLERRDAPAHAAPPRLGPRTGRAYRAARSGGVEPLDDHALDAARPLGRERWRSVVRNPACRPREREPTHPFISEPIQGAHARRCASRASGVDGRRGRDASAVRPCFAARGVRLRWRAWSSASRPSATARAAVAPRPATLRPVGGAPARSRRDRSVARGASRSDPPNDRARMRDPSAEGPARPRASVLGDAPRSPLAVAVGLERVARLRARADEVGLGDPAVAVRLALDHGDLVRVGAGDLEPAPGERGAAWRTQPKRSAIQCRRPVRCSGRPP